MWRSLRLLRTSICTLKEIPKVGWISTKELRVVSMSTSMTSVGSTDIWCIFVEITDYRETALSWGKKQQREGIFGFPLFLLSLFTHLCCDKTNINHRVTGMNGSQRWLPFVFLRLFTHICSDNLIINKSYACIYAKERLLNDAELIAWLSGLNMYVSLAAVGRHPLFFI